MCADFCVDTGFQVLQVNTKESDCWTVWYEYICLLLYQGVFSTRDQICFSCIGRQILFTTGPPGKILCGAAELFDVLWLVDI